MKQGTLEFSPIEEELLEGLMMSRKKLSDSGDDHAL